MKDLKFFEQVVFRLKLNEVVSAGLLNRRLKGLGARLYYDVYSFDRDDKVPDWQSNHYLDIALLYHNKEVYAQDNVDEILLRYPFATVGSEYIQIAVDTMMDIAKSFNAPLILNGNIVLKEEAVCYLDGLTTKLLDEWGEEPGSEAINIMIENLYNH